MTKGLTSEDPIIGVATIVVYENKILVGYDGEKKKHSFPGGHWEGEVNNETLEEAAARETFEETGGHSGIMGKGVRCKNFRQLYDYVFNREGVNKWYRSVGFVAEYESGEIGDDPTELRTRWKFVLPEEANELDLFEPARIGLRIFMESLRG